MRYKLNWVACRILTHAYDQWWNYNTNLLENFLQQCSGFALPREQPSEGANQEALLHETPFPLPGRGLPSRRPVALLGDHQQPHCRRHLPIHHRGDEAVGASAPPVTAAFTQKAYTPRLVQLNENLLGWEQRQFLGVLSPQNNCSVIFEVRIFFVRRLKKSNGNLKAGLSPHF